MGYCERLKFARRRMGLSQKEFAKKADLSQATIARLEQDETHWTVAQAETFDKILLVLDGNNEPWLKRLATPKDEDTGDTDEEIVKCEGETTPFGMACIQAYEKLKQKPNDDDMTLSMLEFIMDGLRESESHEEFKTHIKIMKRILNKY